MVDFMKWALTDGQKFAARAGLCAAAGRRSSSSKWRRWRRSRSARRWSCEARAGMRPGVRAEIVGLQFRRPALFALVARPDRRWRSASSCRASRCCRSRSSASTSGGRRPGIRSPGEFGALPFIWGTLYSSILALLIATPIALGIAVFISELCPGWLQAAAGVSHRAAGRHPVDRLRPVGHLRARAGRARARDVDCRSRCGSCRSSAARRSASACWRPALILAIMVIPFTSSVAREVLKSVPLAQREGAYALGATRFEAIRAALFYARTGIIGASCSGSAARSARRWP